VILAIFAVFALIALIFLSGYERKISVEEVAYGSQVVIWGTQESKIYKDLFREIAKTDEAFGVVKYVRVEEEDFDDLLVNAIAEGRSPDMVVLPAEDLVKHRAKLRAIPYETIPQRTFRDTYVDGAEVFALKDGIYAIPFAVDPLMLYWNRDILASNGLALPPKTWEEVVSNVVPRVTQRDNARNILQSALAFGEMRNVTHASEILALLALQSGSKMVTESDRGYLVSINQSTVEGAGSPLEAAVQFYTDFSNANSPTYSWNRAMPYDKNMFIAGDLAMYIGYGSEAENIDSKNPNLNFDITTVPQGGAATAFRTYGQFYGFAIPRASTNASGAFAAAQKISSKTFADSLTVSLNLAPVRRDLVSVAQSNSYRASILQSAIVARGWLDPDPIATKGIFTRMVEDVVSNRVTMKSAVTDAINRLTLEY